jgi:hypothetical protein
LANQLAGAICANTQLELVALPKGGRNSAPAPERGAPAPRVFISPSSRKAGALRSGSWGTQSELVPVPNYAAERSEFAFLLASSIWAPYAEALFSMRCLLALVTFGVIASNRPWASVDDAINLEMPSVLILDQGLIKFSRVHSFIAHL